MKSIKYLAVFSLLTLVSCGGSDDGGSGPVGQNDALTAQKFAFSVESQCANKSKLKAIYGYDDRVDVCSYKVGRKEYEMAKSTAMLVKSEQLVSAGVFNGKKIYHLKAGTLEDQLGAPACSNVNFKDEKAPGFCSGFLYNYNSSDRKSLLTAGHCFWGTLPSETRVVFTVHNAGTKIVSNNAEYEGEIFVTEDQVFKITNNTYESEDFSKVTLDREVPNTKPFEVESGDSVSRGDSIEMFGHPFGLLLKYTQGVVDENHSWNSNFGAHISSFGGNSGSPVVNSKTGKIAGILVSGQDDYNYNYMQDCMEQVTFSNDDSGNEGVLKIGKFIY